MRKNSIVLILIAPVFKIKMTVNHLRKVRYLNLKDKTRFKNFLSMVMFLIRKKKTECLLKKAIFYLEKCEKYEQCLRQMKIERENYPNEATIFSE